VQINPHLSGSVFEISGRLIILPEACVEVVPGSCARDLGYQRKGVCLVFDKNEWIRSVFNFL
jgi:hypothetical protein